MDLRFSKYFKLEKKQHELDFVDVPLNTDIRLFIDPYTLSIRSDEFSMQCSNIVINFFQRIIDDIKDGRFESAKYNLNRLREPNETHLGLSNENPIGKGVSGKQSIDIFEKLKNSRATKTGFLKDLSDCELVIPGISRDKISDIVTNIIKIKLLEYTQAQCNTYNIPTIPVSSGKYWNPQKGIWEEEYFNLPVYKNKKIILVPKAIVRYTLEYNQKKYYNGFVLEFLQEEHLNANTALVQLLKNGTRRVTKKDLKKDPRYKPTKQFLYEFSNEHPEVFEKYTDSLPENVPSLSNEQIEAKQQISEDFDYDALIENLKKIPTGKETEDDYHNLIIGILEVIFYPNLFSPEKEVRIHNGRKRIDITYQNAAKDGFFEYIINHVPCPFIIAECKNYSEDPQNPELDQLSGRFSPRRGRFGFLVCRKVENKDLMDQRCKDTACDDRGYIMVLDDNDLITLINFRKRNDQQSIEDFLTKKYKNLVM